MCPKVLVSSPCLTPGRPADVVLVDLPGQLVVLHFRDFNDPEQDKASPEKVALNAHETLRGIRSLGLANATFFGLLPKLPGPLRKLLPVRLSG